MPDPLLRREKLNVPIVYVHRKKTGPIPLAADTRLPDEGRWAPARLIENSDHRVVSGPQLHADRGGRPEDGDLVAAFKEALAGEGVSSSGPPCRSGAGAGRPAGSGRRSPVQYPRPDDRLRLDDCRANVFHIMPSRAMKADALAQYLVEAVAEMVPDPRHAGARPRVGRRAGARGHKFGAEIVETANTSTSPPRGVPTATSRSRPDRC